MDTWFHVTPLFLLPAILKSGGFRCGADLATRGSPRRRTSRADDDQPVKGLGGRSPGEFILLFTSPNPPLLTAKVRGRVRRGEPGKAFPHVRFKLNALKCLEFAKWEVYGSIENVGRTLRDGKEPVVKIYRSRQQVQNAGVKEIMVPASILPDRLLPLTAVSEITTFSQLDCDLVQQHLCKITSTVSLTCKPMSAYILGQSKGRGQQFAVTTRALCEAIWKADDRLQAQLSENLAELCFD